MPETAAGGRSLFLQEEAANMPLTWQFALGVGLMMKRSISFALLWYMRGLPSIDRSLVRALCLSSDQGLP